MRSHNIYYKLPSPGFLNSLETALMTKTDLTFPHFVWDTCISKFNSALDISFLFQDKWRNNYLLKIDHFVKKPIKEKRFFFFLYCHLLQSWPSPLDIAKPIDYKTNRSKFAVRGSQKASKSGKEYQWHVFV